MGECGFIGTLDALDTPKVTSPISLKLCTLAPGLLDLHLPVRAPSLALSMAPAGVQTQIPHKWHL